MKFEIIDVKGFLENEENFHAFCYNWNTKRGKILLVKEPNESY